MEDDVFIILQTKEALRFSLFIHFFCYFWFALPFFPEIKVSALRYMPFIQILPTFDLLFLFFYTHYRSEKHSNSLKYIGQQAFKSLHQTLTKIQTCAQSPLPPSWNGYGWKRAWLNLVLLTVETFPKGRDFKLTSIFQVP